MIQEKNKVYKEDCLLTQNRPIEYDYVITSPPDFEEIGFDPSEVTLYQEFLLDRIVNLKPKSGFITIFISDRKYKGGIIGKHTIVRELMESLDYKMVSQKIWVKSYLKNLYRLNYTYILTFKTKDAVKLNPILPDVFYVPFEKVGKYSYNFAKDIVVEFIKSYTIEGQTVYDPFIGSGQTALACIDTKRHYYGSEIDSDTYDLCNSVIGNYTGLWTENSTIPGFEKMEPIQTK